MTTEQQADVCLILEGTYPYVAGGVSTWAHQLILAQSHLTFALACLVSERAELVSRYEIPPNVTEIRNIRVGRPPSGARRLSEIGPLLKRLEVSLSRLLEGGGLAELAAVRGELAPFRRLGSRVLLNSPEAWELVLRMYHASRPDSAFLDYFWTWRAILGGIYSMLFGDLPPARVYHAVSTGYAGLYAARAHLETGRPVLLTEHGIYTNERQIEIAMADWLHTPPQCGLSLESSSQDLRPMWMGAFAAFSRACYQAANRIITLHSGNQQFQISDGADLSKLEILPNAIDFSHFSALAAKRVEHPPAIALIGRVVPIKDVKTFVRAAAILREIVPELQSLVLGPADEDPSYYAECQDLVHHMGLDGCLRFTGPVSVEEYLPQLDVVVLTSISEAQPLVILEAGAAGIPSVATDVGACREMIYGGPAEDPLLGPGGEVTPLANPTATALAVARLLADREYWERASRAISERVRRYYDRNALDRAYRELYEYWRAVPTGQEAA